MPEGSVQRSISFRIFKSDVMKQEGTYLGLPADDTIKIIVEGQITII